MSHTDPDSATIESVRVGRKDLGAASVLVDVDLVTIVLSGASKRVSRIPLGSIKSLAVDGNALSIRLVDGKGLTLAGDSAAAICELIGVRSRAVPELTRGLRSLGSARRIASAAGSQQAGRLLTEQRRFFAPLLDARGAATAATSASSILSAFDARSLSHSIDDVVKAFASSRYRDEGPHRRALQAELEELTEGLRLALSDLATAAADAEADTNDLVRWRRWSTQLRAAFEAADRAWMSVAKVLSTASAMPESQTVVPLRPAL